MMKFIVHSLVLLSLIIIVTETNAKNGYNRKRSHEQEHQAEHVYYVDQIASDSEISPWTSNRIVAKRNENGKQSQYVIDVSPDDEVIIHDNDSASTEVEPNVPVAQAYVQSPEDYVQHALQMRDQFLRASNAKSSTYIPASSFVEYTTAKYDQPASDSKSPEEIVYYKPVPQKQSKPVSTTPSYTQNSHNQYSQQNKHIPYTATPYTSIIYPEATPAPVYKRESFKFTTTKQPVTHNSYQESSSSNQYYISNKPLEQTYTKYNPHQNQETNGSGSNKVFEKLQPSEKTYTKYTTHQSQGTTGSGANQGFKRPKPAEQTFVKHVSHQNQEPLEANDQIAFQKVIHSEKPKPSLNRVPQLNQDPSSSTQYFHRINPSEQTYKPYNPHSTQDASSSNQVSKKINPSEQTYTKFTSHAIQETSSSNQLLQKAHPSEQSHSQYYTPKHPEAFNIHESNQKVHPSQQTYIKFDPSLLEDSFPKSQPSQQTLGKHPKYNPEPQKIKPSEQTFKTVTAKINVKPSSQYENNVYYKPLNNSNPNRKPQYYTKPEPTVSFFNGKNATEYTSKDGNAPSNSDYYYKSEHHNFFQNKNRSESGLKAKPSHEEPHIEYIIKNNHPASPPSQEAQNKPQQKVKVYRDPPVLDQFGQKVELYYKPYNQQATEKKELSIDDVVYQSPKEDYIEVTEDDFNKDPNKASKKHSVYMPQNMKKPVFMARPGQQHERPIMSENPNPETDMTTESSKKHQYFVLYHIEDKHGKKRPVQMQVPAPPSQAPPKQEIHYHYSEKENEDPSVEHEHFNYHHEQIIEDSDDIIDHHHINLRDHRQFNIRDSSSSGSEAIRVVDPESKNGRPFEITKQDYMRHVQQAVMKYMKQLETSGKLPSFKERDRDGEAVEKQYFNADDYDQGGSMYENNPKTKFKMVEMPSRPMIKSNSGPTPSSFKTHKSGQNNFKIMATLKVPKNTYSAGKPLKDVIANFQDSLNSNIDLTVKGSKSVPKPDLSAIDVGQSYLHGSGFDHSAALKTVQGFDSSNILPVQKGKLHFNQQTYHDINSLTNGKDVQHQHQSQSPKQTFYKGYSFVDPASFSSVKGGTANVGASISVGQKPQQFQHHHDEDSNDVGPKALDSPIQIINGIPVSNPYNIDMNTLRYMLGGIAQAQVEQQPHKNDEQSIKLKGTSWMSVPTMQGPSSPYSTQMPIYQSPPSDISNYKFNSNFDGSHFKINIPKKFKSRPMNDALTSSSNNFNYASWDSPHNNNNNNKQKEFSPELFLNPQSSSNNYMPGQTIMLKPVKKNRGSISKSTNLDTNLRPPPR